MSKLRGRGHRGALKVKGHFLEQGLHGDSETPRSWASGRVASIQGREILKLCCCCYIYVVFELNECTRRSEWRNNGGLWGQTYLLAE